MSVRGQDTAAMNLLDDLKVLQTVFSREVSELPDLWTPTNPQTGCCHVASLLLHDRHGGKIIKGHAVLPYGLVVHYWNLICGATIDATRCQFPMGIPLYQTDDATDEDLNQVTAAKFSVLLARFNRATLVQSS